MNADVESSNGRMSGFEPEGAGSTPASTATRSRRRIARMRHPDIRAMAYFVHEMKDADGVTIRAALKYLIDRYTYHRNKEPA